MTRTRRSRSLLASWPSPRRHRSSSPAARRTRRGAGAAAADGSTLRATWVDPDGDGAPARPGRAAARPDRPAPAGPRRRGARDARDPDGRRTSPRRGVPRAGHGVPRPPRASRSPRSSAPRRRPLSPGPDGRRPGARRGPARAALLSATSSTTPSATMAGAKRALAAASWTPTAARPATRASRRERPRSRLLPPGRRPAPPPGLLAAPSARPVAGADGAPFHALAGNHDLLVAGESAPRPRSERVATGDRSSSSPTRAARVGRRRTLLRDGPTTRPAQRPARADRARRARPGPPSRTPGPGGSRRSAPATPDGVGPSTGQRSTRARRPRARARHGRSP